MDKKIGERIIVISILFSIFDRIPLHCKFLFSFFLYLTVFLLYSVVFRFPFLW